MPIYEYRCEECGTSSTFLVLKPQGFAPVCKKCGGQRLTRLISRVAVLHSDEARMERLADPSRLGDLDENDPRSMARWMKRMGRSWEGIWGRVHQMVDESIKSRGCPRLGNLITWSWSAAGPVSSCRDLAALINPQSYPADIVPRYQVSASLRAGS
jgi:putative FmdB family regulatory protein